MNTKNFNELKQYKNYLVVKKKIKRLFIYFFYYKLFNKYFKRYKIKHLFIYF